ncbi:hypothetical protein Anapl_03498 [Anas platyrhynchos]|uniref:Uncharacterized protein n=1 Tax=Anas platyrhynchos TaxID=8839 RepID=R0LTN2_ANAPL|nr:hypothetical protein Anapl_03498 [Anas platyrhynchos]
MAEEPGSRVCRPSDVTAGHKGEKKTGGVQQIVQLLLCCSLRGPESISKVVLAARAGAQGHFYLSSPWKGPATGSSILIQQPLVPPGYNVAQEAIVQAQVPLQAEGWMICS